MVDGSSLLELARGTVATKKPAVGKQAGGAFKVKYKQKRVLTRTEFAFGEAEFRYSFRHGASLEETTFDYFQVARGRKHTAIRDWSRFQLGALLALMGVIAIAAQSRIQGFEAYTLAYLAPGAALLGLFAFAQTHFVVIQAGGNPLWIIDDSTGQTIVAEIDRRRRDRLVSLYGALNLANEPYLEIRKIEWLVSESALTRDEADFQIARVTAAAASKVAAADEAAEAELHSLFAREAIAV